MRPLIVMLAMGGGAALMPAPQSAAEPAPVLTREQVLALGKRMSCRMGSKSAQPANSETAGATPAPATSTQAPAGPPALLPGYGEGGLPITTAVPSAQAFFDNGLQLAHAFSHDEAAAAMRESVRLDPGCAMCLWGEVYATGPTINFPVEGEDLARLSGLMARAERLARTAAPRDRALIAAMAARYRNGGGGGPGDLAYARAMEAIAAAEPANDQLRTLAADAWLVYAVHSGEEQYFARARAMLSDVLTRSPDYVPAIHYYIHVTEIMGEAGQAERYADRLPVLAPAASHLVHMPSHTFYRIGRYADAATANRRAVAIGEADARRIGLVNGAWTLPYHIHNVYFGISGALISGDGETGLELARPLLTAMGSSERAPPAYLQMVAGAAMVAEARFGDAQAMVAAPRAPSEDWTYAHAYWHYARGEAAARLGNAEALRSALAAMPRLVDGPGDGEARAAIRMAQIGRLVLEGRAAMLADRPADAYAAYSRAALLQERPSFAGIMDPPAFWYPVRRDAAAALLRLGLAQRAAEEADAVLRDWPNEPMALATRAAAQERLGRTARARDDRRLARAGWRGDARMLRR